MNYWTILLFTLACATFSSAIFPHSIDPTQLSIGHAWFAMRVGIFTSRDYVDALIDVVENNTDLNAFISFDKDRVRQDADAADARWKSFEDPGRLNGIPIMIKDNIDVQGYTTTAGTPALANNTVFSNAPVVDALVNEGAIIFGKTNMHELAFGITSNNVFFGSVRNPFNESLISGGSSGGNGAGLAAFFTPGAIGTDTGGSVRIPASLCNVVGYRPSIGKYPQNGIVPISFTRDTAGPMGRSVKDIILLDRIITDRSLLFAFFPANLRKLRLGVDWQNFFTDLDSETEVVALNALNKLKQRGVELVNVSMPELFPLNDNVSFPIALFEVLRDLPIYLQTTPSNISLGEVINQTASPDVRGLFLALQSGAAAIPQEVYDAAIQIFRPQLQQLYSQTFAENDIDALIFPTTPLPARPIGQDFEVELNGRLVPTFNTYIRHTDPNANAGIPSVSIPAGFTSNGLPVGIEIDGPFQGDDRLLSIALSIERVFS
jgi:mandelamide amidase